MEFDAKDERTQLMFVLTWAEVGKFSRVVKQYGLSLANQEWLKTKGYELQMFEDGSISVYWKKEETPKLCFGSVVEPVWKMGDFKIYF